MKNNTKNIRKGITAILFAVIIAVLVFAALSAAIPSVQASPDEIRLFPEADSHMRDQAPDTNYAGNAYLDVAPYPTSGGGFPSICTENGNYHAFLRFDLSSIPAGSTIVSARLQMTGFAGFAHGGDPHQHIAFVADDTWGESTITWNNKPAAGAELGKWWGPWYDFPCDDSFKGNKTRSIDITSQVATEFAGDGNISLRVRPGGYWVRYYSREGGDPDMRPQLIVEVIRLFPEADSYVRDQAPDTNYAGNAYLDVAPYPTSGGGFPSICTENGNYHAFLRFDLSSIPARSAIVSARLQMTGFAGFAHGGDPHQHIAFVANDTWDESTITWNNKPAAGAELGKWWGPWYGFPCDDSFKGNKTRSIDITSQVATEFAGDGNISLRVRPGGYWVRYYSREGGDPDMRPQLIVEVGKPDLVITEKWVNWPECHKPEINCTICYNVTNIGNGIAPACHNTSLFVDGVEVAHDHVTEELSPRENYTGCFNYTWKYTPPSDNITVCADNNNTIEESNETNNCLTNTWKCGDVNMDRKVDFLGDAIGVARHYMYGDPIKCRWAGDVDCSGDIDFLGDAIKIARHYMYGESLDCCCNQG